MDINTPVHVRVEYTFEMARALNRPVRMVSFVCVIALLLLVTKNTLISGGFPAWFVFSLYTFIFFAMLYITRYTKRRFNRDVPPDARRLDFMFYGSYYVVSDGRHEVKSSYSAIVKVVEMMDCFFLYPGRGRFVIEKHYIPDGAECFVRGVLQSNVDNYRTKTRALMED